MGSLRFDLREAMLDFDARTGIRLSYETLAQRTGISVDTLKSLASRKGYNATLRTIAVVADALKCDPIRYLVWEPGEFEQESVPELS
jgi:DNA-binding Xre family transcriptional regulator